MGEDRVSIVEMMNKDEAIEFLAGCPGHVLNRVLAQALARRPENDLTDAAVQRRLVLAEAWRVRNRPDEPWDPWELEAVADADPAEYPPDWPGEPFFQNGFCGQCRTPVVSHAKLARCPFCGQQVGLT